MLEKDELNTMKLEIHNKYIIMYIIFGVISLIILQFFPLDKLKEFNGFIKLYSILLHYYILTLVFLFLYFLISILLSVVRRNTGLSYIWENNKLTYMFIKWPIYFSKLIFTFIIIIFFMTILFCYKTYIFIFFNFALFSTIFFAYFIFHNHETSFKFKLIFIIIVIIIFSLYLNIDEKLAVQIINESFKD